MATAAIATISLNKVFIISKYQVVKEICNVEINDPSHYWCKVLVTHNVKVLRFVSAWISIARYRARSYLLATE